MNGYQLTKAFYDEVEENEAMQVACKPHHQSLYTWICELRNRTKRDVLDLPVMYTMQMSFIGSQHTLAKAIDDLAAWGIIEVLMQTKGYGTKVKIANAFMQKHCNSDANAVQLDCNNGAIAVQTTKSNKRGKREERDLNNSSVADATSEVTLTHKLRLAIEELVPGYYWNGKDGKNAQELADKLKHTYKASLSKDPTDEQVVETLKTLITKSRTLAPYFHFQSVAVLNEKFNATISEIRNPTYRNGKPVEPIINKNAFVANELT